MLNIILFAFLILHTDGRRRFRIRTGSSNSSDQSYSNTTIALLCVAFLLPVCACQIGCELFKSHRQEKRRKRIEQEINNLIDIHIHNELLQMSSVDDPSNGKNLLMDETNVNKLSTNKSNQIKYISIPLSVQLFNNSSDKNELGRIKVQDSICPQQTINREEEDFSSLIANLELKYIGTVQHLTTAQHRFLESTHEILDSISRVEQQEISSIQPKIETIYNRDPPLSIPKRDVPSIEQTNYRREPSQDSYQSNHSTKNTATISWNPIATLYGMLTQYQSPIEQKPIQTKKNKFQQFAITVAGGNGNGHQLNQLYNPNGIFIDNDKSIYIADSWNHRVVKWKFNSNKGEIITGGNGSENQNNQLNYPTNIIFDKKNNSFIISDYYNNQIIRYFDRKQTSQQTLISNIRCYGLAIDQNGFIYASYRENHEVRRWKQGDTRGELVAGGNGLGNHLNQLNEPSYIFIDEDYSLYISDENNHRVMKWKKNAKEGIIVAGGNGEGNSLNQLHYPHGMIVDRLGQIYVADFWNHRIMRWCEGDKEGEIVVGGNGKGNQLNQLNYPTGLSFDNEENLYVVDWGNHRIQKYKNI
ncbi:unnamed protein product [Adineta steineri]|uniref:Uncharacterized protein n=1 Tax=Adineta steineri TaxID=433720 RepID=A0A819YM43_9BILA|nr:unnamed protein product [Adineta steineri]CAF4151708.1 unnamed protein product [Adineta steineri]